MDSRLIMRNLGKNDKVDHSRPNFGTDSPKNKKRKPETMLEDILAEENIILEEDDE